MPSGRPDLIQRASDLPGSLDRTFRAGRAVVFPWRGAIEGVYRALDIIERYLAALPVEVSFHGTDGLVADRQSLWVASTGLGCHLHSELSEISLFDGDAEGGSRGIEMLKQHPEMADSMLAVKSEIDDALRATLEGLRLHEELPSRCLTAITVRYRAIRYSPALHDAAGIGMHPDGNVISALVTNQPGLTVLGGPGWIERPVPEAGVVVMPGSILSRWSGGALRPTVHAVEIRRGDPVKCTVVGFLNFADGSEVPRSRRFTGSQAPFRNEISRFKIDDMHPDGDLASFYRARGFVVTEGGKARFLTFGELTG
jgi:hypothetical protein